MLSPKRIAPMKCLIHPGARVINNIYDGLRFSHEVVVNVVITRDAMLPYEYDGLHFVADAVTRSIAWPSSKMKPYKPGESSSSRH